MKKTVIIAFALVFGGAMIVRAADANENWAKMCAKCDGADGAGQTKMGEKLEIKDFTDAKVQAGFKDEDVVKAIRKEEGTRMASYGWSSGGKPV